jgi:hypothetical protein
MTTASVEWSGRVVQRARDVVRTWLPAPCGKCGRTVLPLPDNGWVVGHKVARSLRPDLALVVSNWQPEHRACSDASGQAAVIEKAKRDALAEHGIAFSPRQTPGQPPPLPAHTPGADDGDIVVREGLDWASLVADAPEWLAPFLVVPEDAAPPLWVSGVHSEAVCSYGSEACEHGWPGVPFVVRPSAIAWMESVLKERGRPLRLRWWQKLAVVLQLQHRADGSLCFRVVLESGPRRIGKSVRLRGMALWRLEHGPDLFEPEQLIVHTGKDLAIVREVLRKAWSWADARLGWSTKKGMTEPEVSHDEVNRWVARSKDATTGYDCCLALVDESWDVKPASIDDDLEPSMLERESPQLVLTSTSHRRATSLMRGRIVDVLTADDGETMILIWGVPLDADASDPAVWRAASPHWSEDRAALMATKYAKAAAGEQDPEFDDPDPMEGFMSQYLNRWRLRPKVVVQGDPIIDEQAWDDLGASVPDRSPDAIALESWFGDGVSLATAWHLPGDRAVVSVVDFPELSEAVAAAKLLKCRRPWLVGASLAEDPALRGVRMRPQKARTMAAVQDLVRMLGDGVLDHDGGWHLREQVLGVRTLPGSDGGRLVSRNRADAVKAAAWAAGLARGVRPMMIVVPSEG